MTDDHFSDTLAVLLPRLRHAAALQMMARAIEAATAANQPQCITICDAGGEVIVQVRMDGARLNALRISAVKARTAASTGTATGADPQDVEVALAAGGLQTGLQGGLPIWIDGQLAGGIGVSSGTGEVDAACAQAGFAGFSRLSWDAP